MYLNYSDVPGYANIYLDYVYEFEFVEKYYKTNFRNEQDLLNTFVNVNKTGSERANLVSIIEKQYQGTELSDKTKINIQLLKENNVLAVVTGQQLGLLSGPLYTLYKTITAIKLSEELNIKYPDFKFVPVFWMEAEDHDFEEVKQIKILDNENSISAISYNDGLDEETNRGPMGSYKFDVTIQDVYEKIQSSLRQTDFKQSILDIVRNNYFPGATFKSAFRNILFSLFDKYGLIILDPQDADIKKIMKPIFKKDIDDFKFISEELISRSAELDETYHAQIKIKPINLFYLEDEGRYLIEPVGDEFRLKGKRKKFDKATLLDEIENHPEKFSPNVTIRPICQDSVLPTAVYVAGPGEVSYFAQIIPYYHIRNMTPPILYPRASATIIENKVQNILDKYDLKLTDFFYEVEEVANKIAENYSGIKTKDLFDNTEREIIVALERLSEGLFSVDQTLLDSVNSTKEKISHYLNLIKEKTSAAQKKKNDTIYRQIYSSANILFPNENPQEREINFIYFANKYGLTFVDKLYELLNINKFEHQIINL